MKKSILSYSLSMIAVSAIVFINACKKTTDDPSSTKATASELIQDAQKGKPFTTGMINDFTLAYNNDKVILLAANNSTGKIYAIDLNDNDASSSATNTITTGVSDFGAKLAAALGAQPANISILNMEINPISNAVYLLAYNGSTNSSSIVKVTNGGSNVSILDFNNVNYSTINFSSSGERINDIAWGDNSLFISFSHATTLVGKVGTLKAPFKHNASVTNRATTVFKTNWGDNYFTDAPLETMCYAEVNGEKRLLGVTVCAPGFSLKTNDITNGTGLLQVKEYFNLNTGSALKVYPITMNGKTYLIEHHVNGRITRVGQKYLDESQTNTNADATYLLRNSGSAVALGMTDEDVKIIATAGTYIFSAKLTNNKLLTMASNGSLSVLTL